MDDIPVFHDRDTSLTMRWQNTSFSNKDLTSSSNKQTAPKAKIEQTSVKNNSPRGSIMKKASSVYRQNVQSA